MIPYRTITIKSRAVQDLLLSRAIRTLRLGFFLALTAPLVYSQKPAPSPQPTSEPIRPVFRDSKAPDYGPATPRPLTFEDMQYRRYIADRLKSMASDTERLLRLTREINAKIEKSGPGSLSREDLRAMAEIEKLAHNVKWKMQLAAEGNRTQ